MRGKVKADYQTAEKIRITPAYAGKSMELSSNIMVSKDHPRLCGEKPQERERGHGIQGSPPPMRGKVETWITIIAISRITPAYAGKSPTDPQLAFSNQDHPRLCGEKGHPRCSGFVEQGSPPPMRGKVDETISIYIDEGITPAYAGKRFILDSEVSLCWDHPRLCGEKEK